MDTHLKKEGVCYGVYYTSAACGGNHRPYYCNLFFDWDKSIPAMPPQRRAAFYVDLFRKKIGPRVHISPVTS